MIVHPNNKFCLLYKDNSDYYDDYGIGVAYNQHLLSIPPWIDHDQLKVTNLSTEPLEVHMVEMSSGPNPVIVYNRIVILHGESRTLTKKNIEKIIFVAYNFFHRDLFNLNPTVLDAPAPQRARPIPSVPILDAPTPQVAIRQSSFFTQILTGIGNLFKAIANIFSRFIHWCFS